MAKRNDLLNQIRAKPQTSTKPQYELSTGNLDLPVEAQALPGALRDLALQFIGARRRIGAALLESAQVMSEARTLAEEGQWYTFLSVTQTSPDAAERLVNIHLRAEQYPAFADAVRRGWFNQTVAALLARASTPTEVIETLTHGEQPPSRSDVTKLLKAHRESDSEILHNVDNPHSAGSIIEGEVVPSRPAHGLGVVVGTATAAELDAIAGRLTALASQGGPLLSDPRSDWALERIVAALETLGALPRR